MALSEIYHIPSYQDILKTSEHWVWEEGYRNLTEPRDEKLLEKLGITRGSKILFFAGFSGEWAEALRKAGCFVHYTDPSKSVCEAVKKIRPDLKVSRAHAPVRLPRGKYDWLTSFEPYPVFYNGSFPIVALGALARTNGIKVIFYQDVSPETQGVHLLLSKFASIIGANFSSEKKDITCDRAFGEREHEHTIFTIESNPEVQKEAQRCLKLFLFFQRKKIREKIKRSETIPFALFRQELPEYASLSNEQIEKRIKKIHDLNSITYMAKKHLPVRLE